MTDDTIRAALEAGFADAWGMPEAQFHDALRRYDDLRFKALRDRVAELEKRAGFFGSLDQAWAEGMEAQDQRLRAELHATQEALKESERVRGMLVEALHTRLKPEDKLFETPGWKALSAAQALDKKEG